MTEFGNDFNENAAPEKADVGKRIGGYLIDAISMGLISWALSFGSPLLSFILVSVLSLYPVSYTHLTLPTKA